MQECKNKKGFNVPHALISRHFVRAKEMSTGTYASNNDKNE